MALPLIALANVIIIIVGAALTYWNTITEFMLSTALPWFDAEMPEVAAIWSIQVCVMFGSAFRS